MKVIDAIILLLLIIVSCDAQGVKVLNSCGKIGYDEPADISECKQEEEYCCFIHVKNDTQNINKRFCLSAPSDIKKEDIKSEIETYSKVTIEQFECVNDSHFIKNTFYLFLLLLFI